MRGNSKNIQLIIMYFSEKQHASPLPGAGAVFDADGLSYLPESIVLLQNKVSSHTRLSPKVIINIKLCS